MNVVVGLDVMLDPNGPWFPKLQGRRVGLLVNPTSVTAKLEHAIDVLGRRGVELVRLFGPEHGVRAEAQDMEVCEEAIDPVSGLPVVSLYGHDIQSLEPSAQDLDGIDLVIADIQDIGTRYYTYAYTIGLMMRACGRAGIECWVCDRPNPLGGLVMEGNVVLPDMESFVGMQPLATRHGMTLGELATFFNTYTEWTCNLQVVPMHGWLRSMWFDQTGVPWVMTSPNMPTLDTAIVYPGQCLLEGTNMSEGRGTTRPFELFGAPYVDALDFVKTLNAYEVEGARWRAVSFKPMFQKHAGQVCRGAQLHVTDRDHFRSLDASLCILAAMQRYTEQGYGWRAQAYEFVQDRSAIDLLLGDPALSKAIETGGDPHAIFAQMNSARSAFEDQRDRCLMYGG